MRKLLIVALVAALLALVPVAPADAHTSSSHCGSTTAQTTAVRGYTFLTNGAGHNATCYSSHTIRCVHGQWGYNHYINWWHSANGGQNKYKYHTCPSGYYWHSGWSSHSI